MFFQKISYIKFLLRSSNQHGIHSPFVYDLITKCFYDKNPKKWYDHLKNYRRSLLQNKSTIQVEDFGAGSKTLQKNERKISKIAEKAGITLYRAQLLGRLVSYFGSENILEIGTSLGISTASLYLGNPRVNITTLEGCNNTANIAIDSFNKFKIGNINVVIGNFSNTLSETLDNNKYDLIFFDGNHQKEATINYFLKCLDHIHNDSVFVFDDIYWSKGMKEAWQYIKNHSRVTLSIDTFYWGIVFFRKEQKKQHFAIRI